MKRIQNEHKFATFISVIYLLAAFVVLAKVCTYCYPEVGEQVRQVIGGADDSPVREAFGTLADGLEAGLPVKDTVAASVEVLLESVF